MRNRESCGELHGRPQKFDPRTVTLSLKRLKEEILLSWIAIPRKETTRCLTNTRYGLADREEVRLLGCCGNDLTGSRPSGV